MHCNTISNFFDKFLNEVVSRFRPCLVKLKPFVASFPGPNPAPDPQGTGHYQAHQSVYTGRPPIQSKKQYMYMSMCQEVCHNTFFCYKMVVWLTLPSPVILPTKSTGHFSLWHTLSRKLRSEGRSNRALLSWYSAPHSSKTLRVGSPLWALK